MRKTAGLAASVAALPVGVLYHLGRGLVQRDTAFETHFRSQSVCCSGWRSLPAIFTRREAAKRGELTSATNHTRNAERHLRIKTQPTFVVL